MTPKVFSQNWFKAIDAKNYEQLRSLMAKNHQFRNPVTPEALNADAHLGMIEQMMSSFTGSHSIEQTISEGEWVVSRGSWKGTHTGEFNGIPATGKPVNFTITDVQHVVDDKVVEEFMEWNLMTILSQIGALPQQSASS